MKNQPQLADLWFRDYTFYAGPLADRRVRDVPDDKLKWAIDYNQRYIAEHSDPQATIRWHGRRIMVARVPGHVLERRIGLAQEALRACQAELVYRATSNSHQQDTVAAAEELVSKVKATPPPPPEESWRVSEGDMQYIYHALKHARETVSFLEAMLENLERQRKREHDAQLER